MIAAPGLLVGAYLAFFFARRLAPALGIHLLLMIAASSRSRLPSRTSKPTPLRMSTHDVT
jgi:hypothetical protein